ncbi:MAG: oligopeptide transporter, OPT family [Acidobacteriota bacterium]|nr:oligopeptide transporter, OPT family [Blastocatellia bacterium]MDW8411266.1 oligopeptide transporter, OPT family [Acidobacteriota bacterium]
MKGDFKPFISATEQLPELTAKALILGTLLGIIFGASSVYLALKVGLTVSASIPIAVLSITVFRALGKSSILENNIVQTTGSAGESIAAGVAFTLPALLILGYDLPFWYVSVIALAGGILGVLMMIPLRRALIVKEHGNLVYPEGTACAEVLIVGETGGIHAKTVFSGFGVGVVYKFLNSGLNLWYTVPEYVISFYRGLTATTQRIAVISAEISPELLGVGYIIGFRISAIMMAGGALSYLVFIPLIKLFGDGLTSVIYPGTILISEMSVDQVRSYYVYYIGVGAVASGGIISLARALPMIIGAFKSSIGDLKAIRSGTTGNVPRTERDMPISVVLYGSLGLVAAMSLVPQLHLNVLGAILVILFGFFFATVSSRITGEIGSSSNPISGMTIATLLLTCLIFVLIGRTGPEMRAVALSVGAIVCICASNAGTTSQDLKTGFLVGGTPRYMQLAIMTGTIASGLVVGITLLGLDKSYRTVVPVYFPDYVAKEFSGSEPGPNGQQLQVHRLSVETAGVPPGKYLANDKGELLYVVDPGVGGKQPTVLDPYSSDQKVTPSDKLARGNDARLYKVYVQEQNGPLPAGTYLVDDEGNIKYKQRSVVKMPAPQPQIMALITDGILTGKLPWGLVLVGVFTSIVLELSGIAALPFAVGVYLPFSSSAPIFIGGLVRLLVERIKPTSEAEAESSNGVLFSSGLIAGGSICGLLLAALAAFELNTKIDLSSFMGKLADPSSALAHIVAITMFLLLALLLYTVAVRSNRQ